MARKDGEKTLPGLMARKEGLKSRSLHHRDLRDFREGLGIAQRHVRNLAYVFVVYSIFKWVLPALAAVTPPGVDLEAVKASAEYHVEVAKAGCGDPCKAMSCPAGWKTALHAQDPCKCICARVEAATAWDAAQREREKEDTHGAAVSGTGGASKEAAAAAAAQADKLTSSMQQGSIVKADAAES